MDIHHIAVGTAMTHTNGWEMMGTATEALLILARAAQWEEALCVFLHRIERLKVKAGSHGWDVRGVGRVSHDVPRNLVEFWYCSPREW